MGGISLRALHSRIPPPHAGTHTHTRFKMVAKETGFQQTRQTDTVCNECVFYNKVGFVIGLICFVLIALKWSCTVETGLTRVCGLPNEN